MGQHGAGTVQALPQPDGTTRYRVAVTMADGRRVWRRARTEAQAERIRRQLVEARELDLDPSRQTLRDYLRSWLAGLRDARNQRVRPRTLEHYTLVVERHVIPGLDPAGKLPLDRLTARRIQAWIDADPAAPRTVHHHHAVLRRALNVAVRQRILAYNPATGVELPEADADVADPLTLDEAHRLLEATRGDRLHALWRLALVTGLRQGELLGLAWEDIDLGNTEDHSGRHLARVERPAAASASSLGRVAASVTVRSQLQRLDGAWVRVPPKAARAVTTVAIDATTAAVLDEHRRRMAAERQPDHAYFGLVFTTPAGQPYHRVDIVRAFREACATAGIRPRRFHDIRHSTAHLLNDLGVPEDVRQARLGHTTKRMSRFYSGASETQDRSAVDTLAKALG